MGGTMATLALENIKFLKESGFSEKQAESLLQVTQKQAKELLEGVQQKVDQTKEKMVTKAYLDLRAEKMVTKDYLDLRAEKMVTKAYLDLQVENIKKSLIIQVGGVVFSGFLLLGWYVNHLDSRTRAYVDTRFEAQDARLDKIEADISSIEMEMKELKNLIITLIADNKASQNTKIKRKLASLK